MRTIQVLLFSTLLLFACNNQPKQSADVPANPGGTAAVDPNAPTETFAISAGEINWVGKKAIGGSQHIGTLAIKSGTLQAASNVITGGSFVIDMSTIESGDLEGEMKGKLEGHLKSPDFFDVANHPEAIFVVKGSDQVTNVPSVTHHVKGELTIKGITNAVEMPANVSFVGDKVLVATPSFTIDRTKWDVKYGSGLIGTVADKVIVDDINLVASFEGMKK